MMSDRRTILITGSTRGIGRALAERLAGMGHTVIGCGRSEPEIEALRADPGAPHRFDPLDVTDWTAVSAWAGDVLAGSGPPDLLVNNAGVINRNAPLWEVPAAEFDTVIRTNVCGTVNLIRAFLPAMIDRGHGIVVNISSGWGRFTAPEVAPYCASKYAVEGLTAALAQELPDGMAAVAVNPGVIDTEMLRRVWGDSAASCPAPAEWAAGATTFLLGLTTADNGRAASV
jgi:NAD(P)-dependent dehydrogenase (short-subunit alcohol dehydrogenase family)